jgi:HSP20 family protein
MATEKNTQGSQSTSQQQPQQSQQQQGTQQAATTTPTGSDIRQQGGERQRSIQTGREPSASGNISRRPGSSVMYGPAVSPFALMRRMTEDMDRVFREFGLGGTGLGSLLGQADRDLWRQSSGLEQRVWSPQIETFRRGDKLVVRADLPGLSRDDVQVEVENGVLSISGERSDEREENRDDFYRTERSYGQFHRSIALPEGVEPDQVEASFKDGVLEVTVPAPKQPERSARQIPIR